MLVIRFFRIGKKNQPSFKIVVTEKTNSSRRGRFVEQVGTYNPTTKDKTLNVERVKYWISVGAQPSETVHNLLVSEKVIDKKKIDLHKKSKKEAPKEEVKPIEAEVPVAEPTKKEQPVLEEKPVEPEESVGEKQEVVKEIKPEEEKITEEVSVEKPKDSVEEIKPIEDPLKEIKPEEKVEETPKTK
ncbi:MAG: 30S ribosomal protein S16 [Candidatus Nealsonbacteria bacterium]